jgi:hypothetical protein
VAAERAAWKASQPEIDIHRLVFIDETGASTKMARRYGRSPYGQRCVAAIPHGHWKTTTFVGALRATGMTAPMVLDGPMDGLAFEASHHRIAGVDRVDLFSIPFALAIFNVAGSIFGILAF